MSIDRNERLSRTKLLIGDDALEKLKNSRVLIFGLGGVGGYVCEALARAGVGELHLVDADTIAESNLNRQIIASYETIGKDKTEVCKARVLSINPECSVHIYKTFVLPEDFGNIPSFQDFDYIVDAIDTTSAKIAIIEKAKEFDVPIICSMGTGNKVDNTRFEIADISKTSVCPLAKVIRKELKNRNIKGVDVLFSKEEVIKTGADVPASISYVPPTAGLIIGGYVIRKLTEII